MCNLPRLAVIGFRSVVTAQLDWFTRGDRRSLCSLQDLIGWHSYKQKNINSLHNHRLIVKLAFTAPLSKNLWVVIVSILNHFRLFASLTSAFSFCFFIISLDSFLPDFYSKEYSNKRISRIS